MKQFAEENMPERMFIDEFQKLEQKRRCKKTKPRTGRGFG
jgi:hypothetical protein